MVADLQRLRRCLPGDVLRLELLDRPSAMTERTQFFLVAGEQELRMEDGVSTYRVRLDGGSWLECVLDPLGTETRLSGFPCDVRCRIIGGPYREITGGRPSIVAARREQPDDEPFGSAGR